MSTSFLPRRLSFHQRADPPDDGARPLAVVDDPPERLARPCRLRRRRRKPALGGGRIGDHRAQRLVDLVRDRGGELPHRGHPRDVSEFCLCPGQRLLGVPRFGDVLAGAARAIGPSMRVADQRPSAVDEAGFAVGPGDAERRIEAVISLARQPALVGVAHPAPVFRMNRLHPRLRVALEVSDRTTPDLFVPRAHVQQLARLDGFEPEHLRDRLGHRPEPVIALLQRALDAPTGRAELHEERAQADEEAEAEQIVRRQGERVRGRDQPVQDARCADQQGAQAGPAAAEPGAQDHRRQAEAGRRSCLPGPEGRRG